MDSGRGGCDCTPRGRGRYNISSAPGHAGGRSDHVPTRTLSKREAELVLHLEWEGKESVRAGEAGAILAISPEAARGLLSRLTRKGWFERTTRGQYRLIPSDRGPEGFSTANPAATLEPLRVPYFVSGLAALAARGATDQVPYRWDVVTDHRVRLPKDGFDVHITHSHLLFGFAPWDWQGITIPTATIERALADCLHHPERMAGVSSVGELLAGRGRRIDATALVNTCLRLGGAALARRAGYLVDAAGLPLSGALRETVTTGRVRPVPLDTTREAGEGTFPMDPVWRVVVNVPARRLAPNRPR